jgi:hypothetical protein
VQIEIQIVDTHGTLETRIVIGLQAFGHHLNRTLLMSHMARASHKTKKARHLEVASFPLFNW